MKYNNSTIDRLFKMFGTDPYDEKSKREIEALNDAGDLYLQLDMTIHIYRYDEDGELYNASNENSGELEECLLPRFADRQLDDLISQVKDYNKWARGEGLQPLTRLNGLQPSSTPTGYSFAWSTLNLRWASEEEVTRQGVSYLDYGENVHFGEMDLTSADDNPMTQKVIEVATA